MTEPERVRLARDSAPPPDVDRKELLDLHRSLLDEYRFQVKLNSDRIQIYLVLNTAIVTAATGLLKVGGSSTRTLVAAIFAVGFFVALIAATAVSQGHGYYRAIIYKKTLVEDLLGRNRHIEGYPHKGATLAMETTVGMSSQREILDETAAWLKRPVGRTTITGGLIRIFRLFALIDAIGVVFTIALTAAEMYSVWW